ncbi:MAG: methyltransferase domain-containing protein [Bacteroidia bacterium]
MEESLDEYYWEERYMAGNTGWDIGYASDPIRSIIDAQRDRNMKILIPGAGNSWEAEYAISKGFKNVFVLDFSKSAISNFKERVPDMPEKHLILGDFFKHDGKYDLVLEQTFFCAINPQLREKYAKHMYQLLKKGGSIQGVLFDALMNTESPPFGGKATEYFQLFSKYFDLISIEPCLNSIPPRMGKEVIVRFMKN